MEDKNPIKALHDQYSSTGYEGSIEDFTEQISTDKDLQKDAFLFFKETGYDGDGSDFADLINGYLPGKTNAQGAGVAASEETQTPNPVPHVIAEEWEELSTNYPSVTNAYLNYKKTTNSAEFEEDLKAKQDEVDLEPIITEQNYGVRYKEKTYATEIPKRIHDIRTVTTYKYGNFEAQAKRIVAAKTGRDVADLKRDDWAPTAVMLTKEDIASAAHGKVWEKFIKNISDEDRGKFFKEGIEARKGKRGRSHVSIWEVVTGSVENEGMLKITRETFDGFDEKIRVRAEEVEESLANKTIGLDKSLASLEDLEEKLEELSPGSGEHTALVKQLNTAIATHNTAVSSYKESLDEYLPLIEWTNDPAGIADMVGRSYRWGDVAAARIGSAGLNLAAGLIDLTESSVVVAAGALNSTINALTGDYTSLPGLGEMTENDVNNTSTVEAFANILRGAGEDLTGGVRKHQSFSGTHGVETAEDFFEATFDLFTGQAVNVALTASTGGLGLWLLAGSAAGGKMAELETLREKTGALVTPLEYWGSSIAYGLGEYVTERVTLGQFKMAREGARQLMRAGNGLATASSRATLASRSLTKYGLNVNSEGMAELGASLIQNMADKYILGEDVLLTRGLKESYISGAVMSGLGFGGIGLATDMAVSFSLSTEQLQANRNSKEILELQDRVIEIEGRPKVDGKITEKNKNELNIIAEKQKELAMSNASLMGIMNDRLDDLNDGEKRTLMHLGQTAFNIRKKIEGLTDSGLEGDLLKDEYRRLVVELNEIQETKDGIIHGATYKEDTKRVQDNLLNLQAQGIKINYVNVDNPGEMVEALTKSINESDLDDDAKKAALAKVKGVAEDALRSSANGLALSEELGVPTMVTVKGRSITNAGTVASHELFHVSVETALENNDVDIIKVANELEKYAGKRFKRAKGLFSAIRAAYKAEENRAIEDGATPRSKEELERLIAKEILTNFSTFARENNLDMDRTVRARGWDIMRKFIGNRSELSSIKSGEDVLEFLLEYNSRFEKGEVGHFVSKVNAGSLTFGDNFKVAKPGSKKPASPRSNKSVDISGKVQKIYEEKGTDGAFEIAMEYKGMAITKAAKYRKVPGFKAVEDIIVDEIMTSNRGVYGMVMKYDPASKVPLSGYINKFLEVRADEIAGKLLGTEFTKDVTELKDLAADEVSVETNQGPKDGKPKVSSIVRRKLGLDDSQMAEVRSVVAGTLISPTAPKVLANLKGHPRAFADYLLKAYGKAIFKLVKNHMGTGDMYVLWVKKNLELFDKHMPLSALINGKMDLFYKPDLDESGKQKRMNSIEANDAGIPMDKTGAGPLKWMRVSPTLEAWTDWGLGKGMAKNTKAARKTTMARLIARELGLDATMEVLRNPAIPELDANGKETGNVLNAFSAVSELNQESIREDQIAAMVGVQAQRSPDLRFNLPVYTFHSKIKVGIEAIDKQLHELYKAANKRMVGGITEQQVLKGRAKYLEVQKQWDSLDKAISESEGKIEINGELVGLAEYVKKIGISKFINSKTAEAMEFRNAEMVLNTKGARTKQEYKDHIFATWEAFAEATEPHNIGVGFVEVVNMFTLTAAARGDEKAYRGNKPFFDEVVKPLADKINKGGGAFRIVPILVKPQNKNGKHSIVVETRDKKTGKLLTEELLGGFTRLSVRTNEVASGLASAGGAVSATNIDAHKESSAEAKAKVIGILEMLRDGKLSSLPNNVKATILRGLGDHTRGLGRTMYEVITALLLEGEYGPKYNKIEHNLPWWSMSGIMAMYVDKDITPDEGVAKKALLEAINNATATVINKKIADYMDKTGAKFVDKTNSAMGKDGKPVRAAEASDVISKKEGKAIVVRTAETSRAANSLNINEHFNNILEATTSMPGDLIITPTEAIKRGKIASRHLSNQGIMVSAAEDHVGLLYKMIGKGKEGAEHLQWLLDQLVVPYDKAVDNVSIARIQKRERLRTMPKSAELKSQLSGEAFDNFSGEDVVRMYIWSQRKLDTRGIIKKEYLEKAVAHVNSNPQLKAYADAISEIAGPIAYAAPSKRWAYGSVNHDLIGGINGDLRTKELEAWAENVKEIFSEDNLNKLEALFGLNYRRALENSLERMRSGRNRISAEDDKASKTMQGWISNSVGAIMFLNMRSSVLQLLSTLNFINTTDNDPFSAIMRLINIPQYVTDMRTILQSPFLRDRMEGMRIDVNEEDIVQAEREATNIFSKALKLLLNKGFLPTRLMDAAAITLGGAGFYRNRINTYLDSGMDLAEAEKLAFEDFRQATITSQQSSDPRMVSQQQASTMGRFILQFGNTPGQYTRIQIKAAKDIINNRGNDASNVSKIIYYGLLQNALFTMMQQALWVSFFDDDDEWMFEVEGRTVLEGMIGSTLRGLGAYGALIDVAIRAAKVKAIEKEKGFMGKNEKVIIEALGVSPGVKSMARKTLNGMNVSKYRKDEFGIDPWSLHSPEVEEAAWVIEGMTNMPVKRILDKVHHLESVISGQNEAWQDIGLTLGWSEWQLGIGEAGANAKERKRSGKHDIKVENRRVRRANTRLSDEEIGKLSKEEYIKYIER